MSSMHLPIDTPDTSAGKAWTFADSVPQSYQRYLVPVLFDPFAQDLAARVHATTSGDVLETACGTGVVSRHLRAMMPPTRRLTCTDVSLAMLEMARASTPADMAINWLQADACHLPFEAGQFSAVVCQFGMAFMPDPALAMREAWRVLAPGGTLFFSLWPPARLNTHSMLFDEVCERFTKGALSPGERDRPYALSEPIRLNHMLKAAGFAQVDIRTVTLAGHSPSARDLAQGAITGTPRAAQLAAAGVALQPVVEALAMELASHGGSTPCVLALNAILVTARKTDAATE
jgi:SAM-dependent methyltransferase